MKEANEEFKAKLPQVRGSYGDKGRAFKRGAQPRPGTALQESVQHLQWPRPRHRPEPSQGDAAPVEDKVRLAVRLFELHLRDQRG